MFLISVLPGFALAKNCNIPPGQVNGIKAELKAIKKLDIKNRIKCHRNIRMMNREFTDVENDWSREEVAEAAIKGFVNGYEDFTYRPNKPVTCLETVVLLVKAAGLEDGVKYYELSDEQRALLKKIPEWGKSYIAVALDQGILQESEMKTFNPQQGAKRYEVSLYISRLLANLDETENTADQDETDAANIEKDSDNDEQFVDEEQIPQHVRIATRLMKTKGIVNGYPDGSFRPMRVVKRNEIAVMLNRMDRNCLNTCKENIVQGSIKEIEAIDGGFAITVVDDNGALVKVRTNEQTKLFFRGKLYDINSDIGQGRMLRILFNQDGEAALIRVIPLEEQADDQEDKEETQDKNQEVDTSDEDENVDQE